MMGFGEGAACRVFFRETFKSHTHTHAHEDRRGREALSLYGGDSPVSTYLPQSSMKSRERRTSEG